jgi:lysophospholipase L1-like esterase
VSLDRTPPSFREKIGNVALCVLLAGPLLVYAKWMQAALWNHQFTFRRLDLLLLWVVIAYAILSVCCVVLWRRATAMWVALVYAALLAVGTAEFLFYQRERPLTGLPWMPGQMESTAADTMPGISGNRRFTINTYGIRGPEMPLEQAAVRILFVGGSSVESFQVTDEQSWPWLVGSSLSSALSTQVFCGSAGRSGQIARGHEYVLRHYRYATNFEWIVVMCGINDAGALLWDNYSVRVATVPESTLLGRPLEADGPYYRKLSCIRMARQYRQGVAETEVTGIWYAEQRAIRARKLQENPISHPPLGLPRALAQYRMDLEGIIEVCRAKNQRLVFLTQPTLYEKNLPPELAALLWEYCSEGAYTADALAEIMSAYNATLVSVCKERGVEYLDLAAELPKDSSVLYDDCHFNVEGSRRVAALVSRFLEPRIRTNQLVAARAPGALP